MSDYWMSKYISTKLRTTSNGKPVDIFVNHKLAVFSWAEMNSLQNQEVNLITFDSHNDFAHGQLQSANENSSVPILENISQHPDSSPTLKEFYKWNPLSEEENERILMKRRFLKPTNDNQIDVAFGKGIINNAFRYFVFRNLGQDEPRDCKDCNGTTHTVLSRSIDELEPVDGLFVLDIDLDVFARPNGQSDGKGGEAFEMTDDDTIKQTLVKIHDLFTSEKCLGLTIALESDFCGGQENCEHIWGIVKEKFGLENSLNVTPLIEEYEKLHPTNKGF